MKSHSMSWLAVTALCALGFLAACSNPRTSERLGGGGRIGFEEGTGECDAALQERPFGQRFTRFGELMVTEFQDQKADIGKRIDVLGDEGRSYAKQTGKEWDRTMATLVHAPKAPFIDAGLHRDSLGETLGGSWERAKADARCFWGRAWRSLKMLE